MKPISALALLPLGLFLACLNGPAATNDAAILGFAPESVRKCSARSNPALTACSSAMICVSG